MKFKKGDKLLRISGDSKNDKEKIGEIITVKKKMNNGVEGVFKSEEYENEVHYSNHFEKVNKFEIGEEIIFKTDNERVYYCGRMKDGNQLVETKEHGNLMKVAPDKLLKLKKEDKYKLLLDDIRETASVAIHENEQREIVFDRLNKLKEINKELLELIQEIYKYYYIHGNHFLKDEMQMKLKNAIQKAKGVDE